MDQQDGTVDDELDDATRGIVELLGPIGRVSAQRLFGTWGLYLDDRIFGLCHDGAVYFRTCQASIARYVMEGSQPFLYRRSDGRNTVMEYHEVPLRVLADAKLAREWAIEAAACTS